MEKKLKKLNRSDLNDVAKKLGEKNSEVFKTKSDLIQNIIAGFRNDDIEAAPREPWWKRFSMNKYTHIYGIITIIGVVLPVIWGSLGITRSEVAEQKEKLGHEAMRSTEYQKAKEFFLDAYYIDKKYYREPLLVEIKNLWNIADAYLELGEFAEAHAWSKKASNLLGTVRGIVSPLEFNRLETQQVQFQKKIETYELLYKNLDYIAI